MNLCILKSGDRVKYKTLCEAFEVEPKTGNSKLKQLKDFEKYVRFEKEGIWFNILEIKEEGFCTSEQKKASLISNSTNLGQTLVQKSEDAKYLCKRLGEELNLPFEESSLKKIPQEIY